MTRKFTGKNALDNYLKCLEGVQRNLQEAYRIGLEETGAAVEQCAREEIIGRTDPLPAIAGFPTWAPLADSTISKKERQGLGKGGDPASMLYATGELAASIQHNVEGNRVTIGTNDSKAAWLEYGTVRMPARAFIGPSIHVAMAEILPRWRTMLCRTLEGNKPKW